MRNIFVRSTMLLAALLFSTTLVMAAESATKAPDPATSKSSKAEPKSAVDATHAKTAAKGKLIDINSATEAELKAIPDIGAAYASKIIAARPYANKAQLKSRNVLPVLVYEQVKDLIIAKQPVKEAPPKNK